MQNFICRTVCSLAALFSLVVMPSFVQGQEGGGHALDANPMMGGNGQNSAVDTRDFNFGNDIVTGDVGDKYFRGNVDYRSSRDFSGNLPSDDLFRFRADSLRSAAGTQYRTGQIPDNIRVSRSFTDTTVGAAGPNNRGVFSLGGGSTLYDSQNAAVGANLLTTPSTQLRRGAGAVLGSFENDGQVTTLQASPFLGLRRTSFDLPQTGQAQDSQDQQAANQYDLNIQRLNSPMLIDRQTTLNSRNQLTSEMDLGDWQPAPGTLLGERLMRQDQTAEPMNRAMGGDRALKRLDNLLNDPEFNPEEADQKDGVYAQLIAQMRAAQTQTAAYFNPEQTQPDPLVTDFNIAPTAEQLSAARVERMNRLRAMGLLPRDEDENATGLPTNDEVEETEQTPEMLEQQAVESILADAADLMDQLNVELPEVQTLAGERDSEINTLYRDAESMMLAGRYFDAEQQYRQILVLSNDQPLAEIGLVNAMIGAGLVRSAANKLHEIYSNHPELITVRYNRNLLPAPKRIVEVETALRNTMQDNGESGARASLLMAYLGYQLRSPKLTEYGLLIGQTRTPRDPLWPVLRQVWLEQEKDKGIELKRVED